MTGGTKDIKYRRVLAFFILSSIFFLFEIQRATTYYKYRMVIGKDTYMEIGKFGVDHFQKEGRFWFDLKKMNRERYTIFPTKDEYFGYNFFYYLYDDKAPLKDAIDFYAKASVDRGYTDNSRSAAVFQIYKLILMYPDRYGEIVSYLSIVNPYPGILGSASSLDDSIFMLAQFSYDSFRDASSRNNLLFIESLKYGSDLKKNLKTRFDADIKNTIYLNDEDIEFNDFNLNVNNPSKTTPRLLYLISLIKLQEKTGVDYSQRISSLFVELPKFEEINKDRLKTGGLPRVIKQLKDNQAYIYYAYANYYLYTKNPEKALIYIERLREVYDPNIELFVLFKKTHFLDEDKKRFQEVDKAFVI